MTVIEDSNQFYPTPKDLALKMLSGIDWDMIESVLEPSAGKGDLVHAIAEKCSASRCYGNIEIDCCEVDPYLRQILKYEFSGEKRGEILDEYRELDKLPYGSRSDEQNSRRMDLKSELDRFDHTTVRIVCDDFMTYKTYKNYSLIVMNPPFVKGAEHLLKALEMQKNGGSIVCLLNAETIKNPNTFVKKQLVKELEKNNASIEYVNEAFAAAERRTDVEIAIIKVVVPTDYGESDIWERMKKAVDEEYQTDVELKALVPGNFIDQAIQLYQAEVSATLELVREYKALVPYMRLSLDTNDKYSQSPILTLTVGSDNYTKGFNQAKYMRTVRLKYWEALVKNKEFAGKLTKNLKEQYESNIIRMADYEFSAFNIKQLYAELNASMISGVEKAIMELFDKLSAEHIWYPECSENRHYYNGWKTNKAHKVGKKCIIPIYGVFSTYSWTKDAFNTTAAYEVISDLEKAFNYLDGNVTVPVNLECVLKEANAKGKTRNIKCKYFSVDLFKKGTMHIKFYSETMPLVEKLNIYASQHKGWLPPNYGKAAYTEMDKEEKEVVDSFNGDGKEGSGQGVYEKIMVNSAYYLAASAPSLPALAPC